MENMKFIFDVDGTLTPSRRQIEPDFLKFFLDFVDNHEVYLVTGSNREKTIEQIGIDLYHKVKRVYNCAGNDTYEGLHNVYKNPWTIPDDALQFLQDELDYSQYSVRTGKHVELRPGCVNFSIVGRNANWDERDAYKEYDKRVNERIDIASRFNDRFPELHCFVGGETGVDISSTGSDKSQILRDFKEGDNIQFFGDRMDENGNDYPLAEAIRDRGWGRTYDVEDYVHCWKLLRQF